MPYVPRAPVPTSPQVNDLRKAVAWWESEGGAGIHGPHEGYGRGVATPAAGTPAVASRSFDALVDRMTMDQVIRRLFAASGARDR